MINENENVVTNEVTNEQPDNQHYINVLEDYKRNSVPKSKYEKLEEENKALFQALANGGQVTTVTEQEQQKPIEELVKDMRGNGTKNFIPDISFVEKALEFRERVLEEEGIDCFVSMGRNIKPTRESYENAQKTADIYRECLDYANGDNKVFINELQRRMVEVNPYANMYNVKNNNRR